MKLINFPGLNCYTNGIVSIAHALGIDYVRAFSRMWSETDFHFQPSRKVYLSNRLPQTLEELGAQVVVQLCHCPRQAAELLSQLDEGELIILGMDAFYVPWSQFYKTFHGPHFFAARYTKGDIFLCYDPTFGIDGAEYSRADVVAYAYDISRILPVAKQNCPYPLFHDAGEVMANHPHLCRQLAAEICRCQALGAESTVQLAKYMDALQSNRYLYRHYLDHLPPPDCDHSRLMNEDYFAKWSAVKNGLNKASITGKAQTFQEVQELLSQLLHEEMAMAGMMLT